MKRVSLGGDSTLGPAASGAAAGELQSTSRIIEALLSLRYRLHTPTTSSSVARITGTTPGEGDLNLNHPERSFQAESACSGSFNSFSRGLR
jgi:hypothetical protein